MKKIITCLALMISILGYSQSNSKKGIVVKEITKVENVAVTVTVDSAEDIESSFKIKDIKEILEESDDNETLSFKIICNGKEMENGSKSHVSYKVEGNSNDRDTFLKSVKKIRSSAIKYYNNKN